MSERSSNCVSVLMEALPIVSDIRGASISAARPGTLLSQSLPDLTRTLRTEWARAQFLCKERSCTPSECSDSMARVFAITRNILAHCEENCVSVPGSLVRELADVLNVTIVYAMPGPEDLRGDQTSVRWEQYNPQSLDMLYREMPDIGSQSTNELTLVAVSSELMPGVTEPGRTQSLGHVLLVRQFGNEELSHRISVRDLPSIDYSKFDQDHFGSDPALKVIDQVREGTVFQDRIEACVGCAGVLAQAAVENYRPEYASHLAEANEECNIARTSENTRTPGRCVLSHGQMEGAEVFIK